MNFWPCLWIITAKEFRHLRRDPYTLFLAFAVPVFVFLLFGYALNTRIQDVPTAVYNLDTGRYGRALIAGFSRSPVFQLGSPATSEAELLDRLRRGQAKVAIQIPRDYSTSVFYGRPVTVRVWVDGSDAVLAGQAESAARAIGFEHTAQIAVAGTSMEPPLQLEPKVLYNPTGRSRNFFGPALAAGLGETTTLLLVALSMAKEHERGTLNQLRITSIPLSSLIGGKLLACALVGLSVSVILIVLMQVLFSVPIAGSVLLLCASLVAVQGPGVGLGLILTAEARNQAQALQLTYFVFFPSVLLSGLIFPQETMPPIARALSGLIPATWSIQILRGIVLRGQSFESLIQPFAALATLTVLYLTIGSWRLRRRLG